VDGIFVLSLIKEKTIVSEHVARQRDGFNTGDGAVAIGTDMLPFVGFIM
jgi:hypothetical protein